MFKLKPARDTQIHPIALEFPRRDKQRLFMPTVHVHDGEIHEAADFDHTIYCQVPPSMDDHLTRWESSEGKAAAFMKIGLAQDLVWSREPCHRTTLRGTLPNFDAWIGEGGESPSAAWGIWVQCSDCGHRRRPGEAMRAGKPCSYCGGRVEEQRVGPPPRR